MGFDNECILNIQSLPGEYFCPVCRTLIYPNEALQSQCTHLYCKPCLAYIVATTHACPYDGYLVTEADSKPLIESNATLAETIGKVTVYCLYHRSGCQWQGTLSECITHCTSCTFGNSPVVCNRCGTQIIHRQVQEHTQICPGLQPQSQQVDNGQSQASTVSNQAASQDAAVAASAAPSSTTSTATANAVIAASAATPVAPASMPAFSTTSMTAPALQSVAQASTPQQWYQQQQLEHQQYYQMYPVYDPNQQHYHQYAQYQQQAYPQYAQPQLQTQPAIQGQQQPSYVQTQPHHQGQPHSQPQSQTQSQVQGQPLPQLQAQAAQMQQQQQLLVQTQPQSLPQPQSQTQLSAQPAQMQVQPSATGQQPNIQPHSQTIPVPQGQIAGQSFGQPLLHAQQVPLQQQMQALPHQQTSQQQQAQSLPQHHLHTQPQARPSSLQQTQLQPQLHPLYPSAYPQSQSQQSVQPQHPPAYAVTGHQSYQQPQILQQTQPVAPPQRPMVMHPQQQVVAQQHPVQLPNQLIPQQPPRMAPPSGHTQMQVQQQPMLPPPQRPAASHPPQQPQVPAHHHGQQMHQHPGLQSQAPQLGMPPQQSHGHLHPGQQFPQGMSLPHQQIPHGPHVHSAAQPLQQNVPSSQGLATHQTQAVAGRAMVGNNTMPSQFLNQQSPNDLAQSGTNLPLLHESQKSHFPQSVSDGYSLSLSGGPRSGVADKVNHATDMLTEIAIKNTDGSVHMGSSVDIKVRESDSEAVTKKAVGDGKDSDKQLELDLALLPERSCNSGADEENVEAAESKHTVKEELADLPEEGTERSHAHKEERPDENQSEIKYDVLAEVQTDANMQVHSISGAKTREPFGSSRGQNTGEIPGKTPHPQQLTAPNSERSYLQQPSDQYAAPTNEGASIQPGYHGTNMPQLTWQGPPHIPSAGSLPGKEGYPQHTPYGHPSNIPPASPRFPAPDRILTPHISQPGGIHDRRPQEGPPYQLQVPGQNIASAHMRPSSQSFPDHLPRQGQPSMVQELPGPPSGQPYGGGYPSDPLLGGLPGPGVPSTVRVPGHVGFPQQGFPEHGIIAQGQTQSHLSQPHAGGGIPHGDTLTRPPQLLPHSGPFNSSNQMVQRGPAFHPDDQGGLPHVGPSNSLDPEIYGIRRPGFSDVRQPDPLGQPNLIKVNGIPGKMQGDGMLNTAFMHGLAEDRFKTFPNENFRPLPEEGMPRPYPLDLSRHNVGRREFEEDLNHFPRPAHLNPEGVKNFDNYNMRPLVRGSQQVGPDGLTRPFDRALPRPDGPFSAFPTKQSGPYSAIRSGSEHHMLDVETRRSAILREEFGRHMDIPPLQNPNIDFSGLPSSRFGSGGKPRLDEIDPRELHGFTERSKAFSLPSDLSAGSFTDNKTPLPSMLVPGSLPDRFLHGLPDGPRSLRTVEQLDSGNFPGSFKKDFDGREISRGHTYPGELFSQSRISTGEPSFGCGYGRDFPNAMEPFSIKRKPGTMGWCRLCNVDCETVEGLDLHAQTREHQKMAMEIVLAIKRENKKKQRW